MSVNNKRVIVSMTSWTKRIGNVSHVVYSLLKQTVKPDSIEVNLSTEEFPNKENDLPEDLVAMLNEGLVQINWVEKNTGVFKKFIPVLQKYYGEDYYLLSVDDDWLYNENYIETMIGRIGDTDAYCLIHDNFHGYCMIYRSRLFKENFWKSITPKMLSYNISDHYIRSYLLKFGGKFSKANHSDKFEFLQIFNPVFPNSRNKNPKSDIYDFNRVREANIEINRVIGNMK